MARQIRREYARAIHTGDGNRELWEQTLAQACEKTGWGIHAWVIMGNHSHLLLETPEPSLVAGMQRFQGTYTQRYNARHGLFGSTLGTRVYRVPARRQAPQPTQARCAPQATLDFSPVL